jgi:hypothetical protein
MSSHRLFAATAAAAALAACPVVAQATVKKDSGPVAAVAGARAAYVSWGTDVNADNWAPACRLMTTHLQREEMQVSHTSTCAAAFIKIVGSKPALSPGVAAQIDGVLAVQPIKVRGNSAAVGNGSVKLVYTHGHWLLNKLSNVK